MSNGCNHCGSPAVNNHFDRSICPYPCETMHTRCNACGKPLEWCPHEVCSATTVDLMGRKCTCRMLTHPAGTPHRDGLVQWSDTAEDLQAEIVRLTSENEELKLEVRSLEEARATGRCGMGNRYCPGSDW